MCVGQERTEIYCHSLPHCPCELTISLITHSLFTSLSLTFAFNFTAYQTLLALYYINYFIFSLHLNGWFHYRSY